VKAKNIEGGSNAFFGPYYLQAGCSSDPKSYCTTEERWNIPLPFEE